MDYGQQICRVRFLGTQRTRGYGNTDGMHEEDEWAMEAYKRCMKKMHERGRGYTRATSHEEGGNRTTTTQHAAWQAMMAWRWRFFFPFSFFFFVAADIGSDVGRFMGLIRVYPYPLIPAFEGEDIRGI